MSSAVGDGKSNGKRGMRLGGGGKERGRVGGGGVRGLSPLLQSLKAVIHERAHVKMIHPKVIFVYPSLSRLPAFHRSSAGCSSTK